MCHRSIVWITKKKKLLILRNDDISHGSRKMLFIAALFTLSELIQ